MNFNLSRLAYFGLLVLLPILGRAQQDSLNKIGGDTAGLMQFVNKMRLLELGTLDQVSIVHIGDSHIQAGYFTGEIRRVLQLKWGNAGRGLIFPYHVANTTEPTDFHSTSTSKWLSKRNVFPYIPISIGISGVTLATEDTIATIDFNIGDDHELCYGANRFILFYDKNQDNLPFQLLDSGLNTIGRFDLQIDHHSPFTTTIDVNGLHHQFSLKAEKSSPQQTCASIYGLSLENHQQGILYHAIGVNGAKFSHYCLSTYFTPQLVALHPDLIILSLGTNESFVNVFSPQQMTQQLDSLVTLIKHSNPGVGIIVTLPGMNFRNVNGLLTPNATIPLVREAILTYCRNHALAFWDLYGLMGGNDNGNQWIQAGFYAKDHVHFSNKGYTAQGDWFSKALIKLIDQKGLVR